MVYLGYNGYDLALWVLNLTVLVQADQFLSFALTQRDLTVSDAKQYLALELVAVIAHF